MISVTELDDRDSSAWDDYVRSSPYGVAHHLSGWREVLNKTYGYETPYLIARDGIRGQVVGVMPLYILRSFLVGQSAVTMQGGLCADGEQVANALIEAGRDIARQARVKKLIIQDTRQAWPGNLATEHLHNYWRVPLTPDEDELRKMVDRNVRRQSRQGRERGLTVDADRTGVTAGTFHEIMTRFTHYMGTPVFGRRFIDNITREFSGEFVIHVVRQGDTPLGAYFSMPVGNTVYNLWGASLRQYRELKPSYVAYWEILLDFARQGYAFYDMGRSPLDTPASEFKRQWGAASFPVYQQFITVDGTLPQESISGKVRGEQFQRLARAWSHLPFIAHRALGPRLRRHVPFA